MEFGLSTRAVVIVLFILVYSPQYVFDPDTLCGEKCVIYNRSEPYPCVTVCKRMDKLCVKVMNSEMECADWNTNGTNVINENTRGNRSVCLHPNQVTESKQTIGISCLTNPDDSDPLVVYLKGQFHSFILCVLNNCQHTGPEVERELPCDATQSQNDLPIGSVVTVCVYMDPGVLISSTTSGFQSEPY